MSGLMKAAGRTLTAGELREALAGARDDDPVVLVDDVNEDGDRAVLAVEAGATVARIEVAPGPAPDDELLAFVGDLAEGKYTLAEAKREARSLLGAWGL